MGTDVHMTLIDAPIGSRVRIRHLTSRPEISARLRELGFCENAIVRCVTKGYGNIICEVYNTRVGLDSGLARRIHVSVSE
ncbi:MAG TPA: FeoA family protein [Bacteroidota bacterium]|nr:FeoA family protein [Bacteroidota bacterium]